MEHNPSSSSKGRIDVIIGGSKLCQDSVWVIKRYRRAAVMEVRKEPQTTEHKTAIIFEELDTRYLGKPHDDTLVITLDVANYEVSKILIDTRSLEDLIFLSTL